MKIKRYLVRNIEEAIARIKKDLGKDAYILSQKKVSNSRNPHRPGLELLEVTAVVEDDRTDPGDISPDLLFKRNDPTARHQLNDEKERIFEKLKPRPLPEIMEDDLSYKRKKSVVRAPTNGFESARDLDAVFIELHGDLLVGGVDKKLAGKLIHTLRLQADADNISEPALIKERLFNLLVDCISVPSPLKLEKGKRSIVVMVGPTGAGKTTTIAKLASYFKLMEDKKIALISIDSYRIGAEAHLRTYASILDVPFYSVYNERELRIKIDNVKDCDLVFVDTTGRSPNDKKGLLIMEKQLAAIPAGEKEVYLILCASTKSADLNYIYEKYSIFNPDKLIFSKIDESLSLGNLFSLKMKADIPAAYFTTGQRVPEDIEIAYPGKFARRIFMETGQNGTKKEKEKAYE